MVKKKKKKIRTRSLALNVKTLPFLSKVYKGSKRDETIYEWFGYLQPQAFSLPLLDERGQRAAGIASSKTDLKFCCAIASSSVILQAQLLRHI